MDRSDADHWQRLARDLEQTVDEACEHFKGVSEAAVEARPRAGAWSVKEIIGHLVDSAANNLQRFVRLQVAGETRMPDYSQDNDGWVSTQRYQEMAWSELLMFWRQFNHHLAHIIRGVDPKCLGHQWRPDDDTAFRLDALITDYPRHLKEHLQEIRQRLASGT